MNLPRWLLYFIKVKADCGHTTRLYDKITVYNDKGKQEKIGISITTKKPECCLKCYETKMVIRCAWCGGSILTGDPITLCAPKKGYIIPQYAIRYTKNRLVGCLRMGCGEPGLRAGFWVTPGKVYRVLSPFEQILSNTGEKVVAVSDIGDIKEAIAIREE